MDETLLTQDAGSVRPETARILGDLPGRYFLDSWRTSEGRPRASQFCRIQRISAASMTFVGMHGGAKGDKVYIKMDTLGSFHGVITRSIGVAFHVDLVMSEDMRADLGKKIAWLERRRLFKLPENRLSDRFRPKNPESSIFFSDGNTHDAYLLDISEGGASLSADRLPAPDEVVAVGRIVARVMRHTSAGVAVKFVQPQSIENLERLLAPSTVELL